MQPALNFSQLVSLNLRLGKRLLLNANGKSGAIGLHSHMQKTHRCHANEYYAIDWIEAAHTHLTHPHLFVKGCPAKYFDRLIFESVQRCIDLEDLGGLASIAGYSGIGHLPFRLVNFYEEVIGARDRFAAQRDHALHRMRST